MDMQKHDTAHGDEDLIDRLLEFDYSLFKLTLLFKHLCESHVRFRLKTIALSN